jgi:copper(I)-binding protein
MTIPNRRLLLAALLVAPFSLAGASEALHVLDPYVRAVPAGQDQTAAYMTLRNTGRADLALVAAASPAARVVELHTVVDEGGMKKMRPVPKIDIKAGAETRLQPGGLHIMLIGLKEPLKEGAHVRLTLTFQDGSRHEVSAPVRDIGAMLHRMPHGH